MSTTITLTLPDETYTRLEKLAKLTGQNVGEVVATTVSLSLPDFSFPSVYESPVVELSDDEVLRLTELQMEAVQDHRLSELLDRQQAGLLLDSERPELRNLMQLYQVGLLRKAQALNEAVKRGLREPLEP